MDFSDYVRGKSIAIVGPSSSGINYNEEIKNDFDIIIRINYKGVKYLPEEQRELMPHISYYNKCYSYGFFIDTDEHIECLADLHFAVIKQYSEQLYKKLRKYTTTRVRRGIFTRGRFPYFSIGKDNMVQLILRDLSFFEPAHIKVFNVNCYLSESFWDRSYTTQENDYDQLYIWSRWAVHNMISNYDYLQQLYKRGLIEVDIRLADVLELGTGEYMNQIEQQENRKLI